MYGEDGILGTKSRPVPRVLAVRRKRDFDDRVEEEARRQQDVDRVVDLFVAKTALWNEKIFDLLLNMSLEAAEARENAEADMDDAHHQLAVAINLVNTTMQPQYRKYYVYDLVRFVTGSMDIPFPEWSFEQTPFGVFLGILLAIACLVSRYWDEILGIVYARKRGYALTPAQRVN